LIPCTSKPESRKLAATFWVSCAVRDPAEGLPVMVTMRGGALASMRLVYTTSS
jgi:hypothetical protein